MSPYALQPWLAAYPPGSRGALDAPLAPLSRLVDDAAERHGDRPALAYLGLELTFAELRRAVDAFAAALAGLGVGRGDRVAVVLPDCPQHVIAVFGVLRLGAVVVQPEPLATADELGRQIADSGATVAVVMDRGYGALAAVRDRTALRHVVVTSLADYLPRRARLSLRLPIARARRARAEVAVALPEGARIRRFSDLVRQRLAPVSETDVDAEREVAVLRYTTTGAEGTARAAMLTHRGLLTSAYQVRGWLPEAQPGREVVLGGLPISTPEGFTLCLTVSLLLAGTLVLLPRLDDEAAVAALAEHRPTLLPAGADVLRAVARAPGSADRGRRSVRTVLTVGGPLPAELRGHVEQSTGAGVVELHGTAALTHATPASGAHRPGTVGLPLPGTRAKIVDPGNPALEMPVGASGALAVVGPQLFAGYWRDPQGTRAAFTTDGFFLTGDTAAMDAEGFFTVLPRERQPAAAPSAGHAGTGMDTAGTTQPAVTATPAGATGGVARPASPRPAARRPARAAGQDRGRPSAAAARGAAGAGATAGGQSARPRPQAGRPAPRSRPRPAGATEVAPTSPDTPAPDPAPTTPAPDTPAPTTSAPGRSRAATGSSRARVDPTSPPVTATEGSGSGPRPRPARRAPAASARPRQVAEPVAGARSPVEARPVERPRSPRRRPPPAVAPAGSAADLTPSVEPSAPAEPSPPAESTAPVGSSTPPEPSPTAGPVPPAQSPAARAPSPRGRRAAVPPFRVEEVVDAAHVAVVFDQPPPPPPPPPSAPVADSAPAPPGPRDVPADRPHRTGARRTRRRERPADGDDGRS